MSGVPTPKSYRAVFGCGALMLSQTERIRIGAPDARRRCDTGSLSPKLPAPLRPHRHPSCPPAGNPCGAEPLVREAQGVARDVEPLRQLARGREAIAAREASGDDCFADLPLDLAGEVLGAGDAEVAL